MSATDRSDNHVWWGSLKHGGLLIAPSRLVEFFPNEPPPLAAKVEEQLRREVTRLEAGGTDTDAAMLDTVLEEVLGLGRRFHPETGAWLKGNAVPSEWTHRAITGEAIRPRRLWQGMHGTVLPVFVDDTTRLGVGRGRRGAARVVEWLRRASFKIALLTNARQWRIVYAGLDHEAYVEAEAGLWFAGGDPGPQVTALRTLLSPAVLTPPRQGELPPLLAAIEASRRGQAELSAVLGERVRQAVELLIREHGATLERLPSDVTPRHIYLAATRVIMRMVIVLFAEARDLLPRDNPVYHGSYGLGGLREELDRVGGGSGAERLRHRCGAWPRVLALFRLIFEGSPHEALPVLRYGGSLFAPGNSAASDPVQRALAAFEDPEQAANDAIVYRMLDLLTKSQVRVHQGHSATWVEAPVDFSDLSSEYIGILYEGLLDFELHRVKEDDPVIFLALGDEPALPLSRLESMSDAAITSLVENFKKKTKIAAAEGESESEEEEADSESADKGEEEEEPEEAESPVEVLGPEEVDPDADLRQAAREHGRAWARRVVVAGKLVKKPRSKKPEALREHEAQVEKTANTLVTRIVLPGEWFLIRFGGTRKGLGTFYTRPQLAVPTVQRTLRPLAYDPPANPEGQPDEDAPAAAWTPKRPEEILRLKVCDPAMGSGSFLVASLRFLTDALFESLHHHGRIQAQGDQTLITLAEGKPSGGRLIEEHLKCRPDNEAFDGLLRAQLKRHVVERCLYGVDIDPLAVELGRLALWVETMDKELPFEFLDHKLKVGNALVGCWFDCFCDYPALAWEREGGDKTHTNGVHFEQEAWTKAIKKFRNDGIKPELRDWIKWIRGEQPLLDRIDGHSPEELHDEALAVFEVMHAMPVHEAEERANYYREFILNNPSLQQLRMAFDTWCVIWFWPPDQLADAPTPRTFGNPSETTRALVTEIAAEYHFFHWELEFPDVFAAPGGGFDAAVGNPPWEIQKPNSKEFFSNLDPLYRTYGKQEALAKQEEMFRRSDADERAWLVYCARFKALSNWNKHVASPFGDGLNSGERFSLGAESDELHAHWRKRRAGHGSYADPKHPFRHQGSADINTYKMFLEQAHAILREGGQLGFIVPSGIYTDKGTTDLRTLFLTRCRWRWLFGFENRDKVFDIDSRFKFCPVIIQKGSATTAIRTAFMRRALTDWEEGEQHVIPYAHAQVERFSPKTRAILEIRERYDLEVLEKIYTNSVLLGDDGPDGWGVRYATEFHMTNDSKLFPPRPKWEAEGYRPDEYGRWLLGNWRLRDPGTPAPPGRPRWEIESGVILSQDGTQWIHESEIEDMALPIYEGRMIGQFDFSQKGWVSGKGRSAVWRDIPWEKKVIEPQFLMRLTDYVNAEDRDGNPKAVRGVKLGFMDVSSATNTRTTIAGLTFDCPHGNKVPVLTIGAESDAKSAEALCAVLGTFSYDFAMRARLGGLTLNYFIVEETPLPRPGATLARTYIRSIACALGTPHERFAPAWHAARTSLLNGRSWRSLWAITPHERLRLRCILDAIATALYGLSRDDLRWILRDCDRPREQLAEKAFSRTLDPKGFWRVDKEKDPELRHTILTLAAFHDLKEMIAAHGGDRNRGIEAFCNQNNGDGWMLPETLCLADLGLGHDDRARKPQAVRARLSERFLPWQLEQTLEESWAECELHARNILGEESFAILQKELRSKTMPLDTPDSTSAAQKSTTSCSAGIPAAQRRLFPGEPTLFGRPMEDPLPRGKKRR